MLRRLTILAIVVWLAASVPRATGQDWRGGPSPPIMTTPLDRGDAPVLVPVSPEIPKPAPPPYQQPISPAAPPSHPIAINDVMMPTNGLIPSVLPPPVIPAWSPISAAPNPEPMIPVQSDRQTDSRLNWSLGDYGPNTPLVAQDLNPPGQHLGWYADFEIGIMKPHLDTHLSTPAGFAGPTGGPITIGAAPLDWTGVPEFSLGYRFSQGAGELRLSYRLVDTSGTQTLSGTDAFGNPAQLHSTLNVQTLDFDYISPEYLSEGQDISRLLFRDLRAGIGLRATAAYFDNRASGTPIADTHMSSAFGGVGPRMFVELHQDLGRPDFQFYTRLTASGVLGPIIQQFDQTTLSGGTSNFGSYDTHNKNIGMGIFQVESGFSWEPQGFGRRFRFTAAYSWERWWSFGRTDSSDAELTLQGAVIRAEFRY
jgi:hypothetical protein